MLSSIPCHLLGVLLLGASATANAASLLVTTPTDSYDGLCDLHCSLRDAVAVANQAPGQDRILLPAGTFLLSLPPALDGAGVPIDEDGNLDGDLDVASDLIIQGVGTLHSRISGQTNDRLLEVLPGGRLALERLTLEGGDTAHNGGAVENHGQLVIRQALLQHNHATTLNPSGGSIPVEEGFAHGQGGAIANYGDAAIFASHFLDNRATGFWDSNVGRGGAIYSSGNLLVRDGTFLRNGADDQFDRGYGGALYSTGITTVERSAFVNNQTAEQGRGGGIANEGGELKLTNSTLSGNTGALSNGFPNNAPGALPKAILRNVTVAANGGFAVINWGDLLLRNSIVAGNYDPYGEQPANCRNLGSNFKYQAVGLLRNDEPGNCSADLFLPFEQTFTHLLYPLTSQGNKTWVHALRPGSLAIDAGVGNCPNHDQNGMPRPQDGDGDGVAVCDLGAYELVP